ncbi:MAG: hypothetical protein ABSD67_14745 [Terracidiphilus sp.]|jgi:hypothetical protein
MTPFSMTALSMTPLSMTIAIASVVLLLSAGYLVGIRRGFAAREKLRADAQRYIQALQLAQSELERKAEVHEQGLRATIEEALAPLLHREQLSIDLSSLKAGKGARDLTLLLDKIAEAGDFTTVVLSNSEGLALAGNSGAEDLDRLSVNSSFVMLMAERIGVDEFPAPTAILVRDTADCTTLYRIFEVQDEKVALSAIASGTSLTPTTLDAVLAKVSGMLTAKQEN